MTYTIILSPRARKELLEIWIWYEKRAFGIGDKFEVEFYNKIVGIETNPERYPSKKKTFRETKIKTFPFLIIYKIDYEKDVIVISAIFHTSRNPKLKYK